MRSVDFIVTKINWIIDPSLDRNRIGVGSIDKYVVSNKSSDTIWYTLTWLHASILFRWVGCLNELSFHEKQSYLQRSMYVFGLHSFWDVISIQTFLKAHNWAAFLSCLYPLDMLLLEWFPLLNIMRIYTNKDNGEGQGSHGTRTRLETIALSIYK